MTLNTAWAAQTKNKPNGYPCFMPVTLTGYALIAINSIVAIRITSASFIVPSLLRGNDEKPPTAMTPVPISLPTALQQRLGLDAPPQFMGIGNTDLLNETLLGLIASRQCPGYILLPTLERATQWARAQQVVLSGFHSPLEQQVFRSMLRRNGRAIKLLAHSLDHYRVPPLEQASLASGHLLVLSASPPTIVRTTRAQSLARNRLVLALATEVVAPHVSTDSPLATLLSERR